MDASTKYRVGIGDRVDLSQWKTDDADPAKRAEIEARTEENTMIIADLQHKLYAQHERSVLIVLQAMDAAGKDSTMVRSSPWRRAERRSARPYCSEDNGSVCLGPNTTGITRTIPDLRRVGLVWAFPASGW